MAQVKKKTKTPRQARGKKKIIKKAVPAAGTAVRITKVARKTAERLRRSSRVLDLRPRRRRTHRARLVNRQKPIPSPIVIFSAPKLLHKLLAILLIVGLNGVGLSGVGNTMGYYNDTEDSTENAFTAGMLDFRLSSSAYTTLIGPEALGEKTGVTVALPEDGSFSMQYAVSATTSAPVIDSLCNELTVEAKQNGITVYNGAFPGLAGAVSTEFGTWEFRFDLPPLASVPHGAACSLDALFSAWRADTATPEESGFTDEERFSFLFTARMVVLNEIFANPGAGAAPKDREYVELYNNGSTPVDTLGWQISELAGATETFYTIVSSGATASEVQPYGGASTIIASGGYLVLEFGGLAPNLNNTGDTVSLYDGATTLLDSHAYPATAAGKAHVRFPDGIGFWVDPEPTPGGENEISIQDLEAAGFDEETIEKILEMVALKGAPAPFDRPELPTEDLGEPVAEASPVPTSEEVGTTTESIGVVVEGVSEENAPEETGVVAPEETVPEAVVVEEETVVAREEEILPPEPAPEEPQETVSEAIVEEVTVDAVVQEEPAIIPEEPPVVVEDVPVVTEPAPAE